MQLRDPRRHPVGTPSPRPQPSPHLLCPLHVKPPRQTDACWLEGGNLWLCSQDNSFHLQRPLLVSLTYTPTVTQLHFLNALALWLPTGDGVEKHPPPPTAVGRKPKVAHFPGGWQDNAICGFSSCRDSNGGCPPPHQRSLRSHCPPPFHPCNNHLVAMATRLINASIS